MNNAKKESYQDTVVFESNINMGAWKYFHFLQSAPIRGTRHFPLLLWYISCKDNQDILMFKTLYIVLFLFLNIFNTDCVFVLR
jgi:hypothetical protein